MCLEPPPSVAAPAGSSDPRKMTMSQIIYIVGAIVIILALLSFVGLR